MTTTDHHTDVEPLDDGLEYSTLPVEYVTGPDGEGVTDDDLRCAIAEHAIFHMDRESRLCREVIEQLERAVTKTALADDDDRLDWWEQELIRTLRMIRLMRGGRVGQWICDAFRTRLDRLDPGDD